MTSHVRMYEKLIMLLSTSAPGGNKSSSPLPSFSRVQRTTLLLGSPALFIVLFYDQGKDGLGCACTSRSSVSRVGRCSRWSLLSNEW